jgi:RimJ/RimL family protein N-acetyltransferase
MICLELCYFAISRRKDNTENINLFNKLYIHLVELNVFDWNHSASRCYEKVGFKFNAAKKETFEMNGQKAIALNMSIENPQQDT